MFNIGPLEVMVLAIVGLVVLGPDRLPGFIRDATRLLKSLRDMATGARQQLRDELGPEFADIDLRSLNPRAAVTKAVFGENAPDLNPRAAVTRAVFGDDAPDLKKYDPRGFDAKSAANNFLKGADSNGSAKGGSANGARPDGRVSMSKSAEGQSPRPRPRPRPNGPAGAAGRASSNLDDTT